MTREIAVLRDTITDLSDEKKQLQQRLDESCRMNQDVHRLRDKAKEQTLLIQQLQPRKLQRLKEQVTTLKNRVRTGNRLLNQLPAAQTLLIAERQRKNAERRNLLKANNTVRKLQQEIEDLHF